MVWKILIHYLKLNNNYEHIIFTSWTELQNLVAFDNRFQIGHINKIQKWNKRNDSLITAIDN